MSGVDTPRDPPGLNEVWSDEISGLLSQSRCTARSRAVVTSSRLIAMTMSHLECTREPTVKMCGAARPNNGHMEFGHSANMGTPSAGGIHIFILGCV